MKNGDKIYKYKDLNNNKTPTQAIIDRLKDALKAKSDQQLATYLGISRQNIGAARKRNDVPTGWIYKVAQMTGCSMDWLSFGQEPPKRGPEYDPPRSDRRSEFASPQAAYQSMAAPSKNLTGPGDGHEEGDSFGTVVEMLAKIYNSGDATMINAIGANIRAFCEVLDREG